MHFLDRTRIVFLQRQLLRKHFCIFIGHLRHIWINAVVHAANITVARRLSTVPHSSRHAGCLKFERIVIALVHRGQCFIDSLGQIYHGFKLLVVISHCSVRWVVLEQFKMLSRSFLVDKILIWGHLLINKRLDWANESKLTSMQDLLMVNRSRLRVAVGIFSSISRTRY